MEETWVCRSLVISSGLSECFWSDHPSYPKGQPESSQHKGSPCRVTHSTSSLPYPYSVLGRLLAAPRWPRRSGFSLRALVPWIPAPESDGLIPEEALQVDSGSEVLPQERGQVSATSGVLEGSKKAGAPVDLGLRLLLGLRILGLRLLLCGKQRTPPSKQRTSKQRTDSSHSQARTRRRPAKWVETGGPFGPFSWILFKNSPSQGWPSTTTWTSKSMRTTQTLVVTGPDWAKELTLGTINGPWWDLMAWTRTSGQKWDRAEQWLSKMYWHLECRDAISWVLPKPTESESPGERPRNLCSNEFSRWTFWVIEFEKYWCGVWCVIFSPDFICQAVGTTQKTLYLSWL